MNQAVSEVTRGVQSIARAAQAKFERILYGLPCAACGSYYDSNLSSCPTCQCPERVSAVPGAKLR